MKVKITNNLFSITGSSSVKDENGEDVFYVKGRFLSPTHVKWVCDKDKNKLYKVRNKWFNFIGQRAYVYQGKTKVACVKHPPFSVKKFILEGYKDEVMINGDFFSLTSTITKNGNPIGTIKRELISMTNTFTLEADEANIPFLIALVIAIDNICDMGQNNH